MYPIVNFAMPFNFFKFVYGIYGTDGSCFNRDPSGHMALVRKVVFFFEREKWSCTTFRVLRVKK